HLPAWPCHCIHRSGAEPHRRWPQRCAQPALLGGSHMTRLLEVENLTVRFGAADPVRHLSFSVDRGETVAVVGESGSGKSLSALALMRLLPRNAKIPNGRISFE